MPRLFAALALARGDGRYAKLLRALARVDLLILHDWGPEQLNAEQRRDLLEIVEDRYDSRSILITSQLPVDRWYEIIGDPTLADAILDRIIHNAYRIELTGDSMRKIKAAAHDQPEAPPPANEARQASACPHPSQQKRTGNDRSAQRSARPGGSTGTSRARRSVSREGTPRRARVPPVDYRDGLSLCLTRTKNENIIPLIRGDAAKWPTSDRNHGRLQIGTGGRLQTGMPGRLRRNARGFK